MKTGTISTWCIVFLIVTINCKTRLVKEVENPSSGRIFPLLPQYQGVDYLQVWNGLATLRNAVFTLISSTITLTGINLMWIVLHSIFWDGNAATDQDVVDSLKSPGIRIELQGNTSVEENQPSRVFHTKQNFQIKPQSRQDYHIHQPQRQNFGHQPSHLGSQNYEKYFKKQKIPRDKFRKQEPQRRVDAVDTLINSLENEVSLEKLWNFFADPDTSVRNLYLNIGFTTFSFLMRVIPTFFGHEPPASIRSPFPVLADTPQNEILRIWNRLLCPQCILSTIAGNTIVWIGKTLWWTFMSSIPDVVGFGPADEELIPR